MSQSEQMVPSLSCLVISRTPALLNRMLTSLNTARSFWHAGDEVLCSWNGSEGAEAEVAPQLGPRCDQQPCFRIAQRTAYHFASNMNQLAEQAKGDLLVLLNDDLILDPGSLDRAIQIIETHPQVGIVGGRLRSSTGLLTHAGLLFSNEGVPYNRYRPDDLGALIETDGLPFHESGPMPAVTGALMVVRRRDFLTLRFHTDYHICGEDIALCLDVWRTGEKHPYYASDVTGIHDEKTTRGATVDHYDIRKLSVYAANVIAEHPELQAASRYWASQESAWMWKLAQRLRQELAEEQRRAKEAGHQAQTSIDKLHDTLHKSRHQQEQTHHELEAIRASSSWRLTAPLRALANKLKPTQGTSNTTPVEPGAADSSLSLPVITAASHPNEASQADKASQQPVHLIFDALVLGQANRANVSRGGIYRYTSELLIALCQHPPLLALFPYCPDPLLSGSVHQELQELEQIHQVSLCSKSEDHELTVTQQPLLPRIPATAKALLKPLHRRWLQSGWMRARIKKQLQATLGALPARRTVFHTPFQSVPQEVRDSGLIAVAVTVHDMLPRIHPEFFTAETIRQFDRLLEQLRPSDHVICVSESTRRDFLSCHADIPAEQVHVTPLAASSDLRPVQDGATLQTLRQQLGLSENDQVILSLCTLEPRKNLTTLITAFEQVLRQSDGSKLKLVLAGSMGWKTTALTEQLRSSSAAHSIVVTGHIPDRQLASLYSLADAFVYPSVYEGFGLPPLEAMQCGAPVVVGNTSSLPEVVGTAAQLVDPRSPLAIAEALANLLGSPETREQTRQAGFRQAAQFSWRQTADKTTAIYRSILEQHG